MICSIYYDGSGLGDQLFRYITVRTLAEEKGFDWGMLAQGNGFKGDFFKGNWDEFYHANPVAEGWPNGFSNWDEKIVRDENGIDIRSYDPEINFVEGNTIIDGSFEDSKYWAHNLENINKWLEVEPLFVRNDMCIVGFRGGEYYVDKDLGLPKKYFSDAEVSMRFLSKKHQNLKLQIHTEDPTLAKEFFPKDEIIDNTMISHSKHSNMGFNWRSARYAKYAIIPNSAFFILPRLLKHREDPEAITIAPRGWSRRNLAKGKNAGDFLWARPACYYRSFFYI